MTPRTATEFASAQARDAWERGRAAMDGGEFEAAQGWFGRACRLAPSDVTPKVSLAGACLAAGRIEQAAQLFAELSRQVDARLVWVGLASARARLGRMGEAAEALRHALSRHAFDGGDAGLAETVARAAGHPGWCAMDECGRLIGAASGPVRLRVDGRPIEGLAFGQTLPDGATSLHASIAGISLLGSPIALAAIRRLEGVVEIDADGLTGWAWHPADPAREPVLTLAAGKTILTVRPADRGVAALQPLSEPRGFRLQPRELADLGEPISVRGPDGNELAGSPVTPRALAVEILVAADAPPLRVAAAPSCPGRPIAIVTPVFRGVTETRDCLRDVMASAPPGTPIFVVDDASPEPALAALLDRIAADGRVRLLRHTQNLGFPSAANAGLRAALALDPPHDVVLLNSDTRMAAGWLHRLRAAVHGASDIGTATPLSNHATIASYPAPGGETPAPAGKALAALSREAAEANAETVVDAPTGIGFCLYLRHECLAETGLLREDAFAQGYGEENDFCLRARRLGWRHVIAPGVYVAHAGGRSFGAARAALLARNLRVLERLHPGYAEMVAGWIARDPLGPARRRLDLRRWDANTRRDPRPSVLLVTHDDGGGVERCVRARVETLIAAGRRPIVLRPVLNRADAAGARTLPGLVRVDEPTFPNLIFHLPDEAAALTDCLRLSRPVLMEIHHLLGHARAVMDQARALAIPYEMRLHDYAAFCPRITLTAAADRYCGEPDVAGCVACVAAHGALSEGISPPALREKSAAEFAGARRLVVPSADMAARMHRHFPGPLFEVEAHAPDPTGPLARAAGRASRVLVVGAIGGAKGFDILLACARDAASRDLALRFAVVGHTIDDEALFDTGRADITGPYNEGEAADLIAAQRADVGFIPSLWPETWCFALGEILSAGLPALAFDIGAQAERIRRTGLGWLLPLGAPAAIVNRFLLSPPPLPQPAALRKNAMQTAHSRVL